MQPKIARVDINITSKTYKTVIYGSKPIRDLCMKEQTWYSGKESYKYIDRLLYSGERSLRIISPFISAYYAKRLYRIARRKQVYIITSKAAARDEKESKKLFYSPSPRLSVIAYLALLSLIIAALGLYPFFLITVLLLCIAIFMRIRSTNTKLHVKIVRSDFIHEKLYISDTTAITGSANLTYPGTHKNIESISITRNPEDIKRFRRHFDGLWRAYRGQ
jgi:phosphatidylserine/phosphatidylglycerophosphate/cardiolipin synthase-like enzyme